VITVSRLSLSPVKGLKLHHPDEIVLGSNGVAENRRFYLVDEGGRRFGQMRCGPLVRFDARTDPDGERLTLRLPDGRELEGPVELGEAVQTDFHGERLVAGHVVAGPWADAISEEVGKPLRLVRADEPGGGVDRGRGSVSLLSDASVEELARRSGEPVDHRRFRMLIGLAGCEPHEEDEWLGREVEVGEAVVRLHGRVARCAITTQDPETGVPNLDTLREIKAYRGGGANGKDIDFGVYGTVARPGRIRVGDPVRPREPASK
jgi:uncharacterized protein YcbX